jgi:putative ABC transport system permease protein
MIVHSHYFRHGIRSFLRQKTTSLINVLGLSTGIASFLLILLFIQNELSYERHIADSADIYRLVEIQKPPGIDVQHVAITSGPWAPTLKENLPEVVDALRLTPHRAGLFRIQEKVLRERDTYYAESSILRFFNIQILAGNPEGILDEPNTAVLSQRAAERFFGHTDVVGETFRYGDTPFRVTGVMQNYDHNSHLKFEVLLSYITYENAVPDLQNWGSNYLSTFVLLQPGTAREHTEANLAAFVDQTMREMGAPEDAPRPEMYLQPLQDIYLKSNHIKFSIFDARGDMVLVYVFSLVALLILVIACINYINLSTARSTRRAMEVGMRKTLGARPSSIFAQFMGESLITAFIAMVLAIGLVELFLPEFNATLGTDLNVTFTGNWIFNVGLLGLLVLVGLLAGAYPAAFMSRFKPIHALKNQAQSGRSSAGVLRKVLVVVQFGISAMLVLATLVFYQQWNHMRNHELGIHYENVMSLVMMQDPPEMNVFEDIKARFMEHPDVEAVSVASGHNGVSGTQGHISVAGEEDTQLMVRFGFVDHDFFPAMRVEMVQGRNFSREFGTDASQAVIVNEAAVKSIGWEEPLGKQFVDNWIPDNTLTVVGVIRDYNFYSLHGEIEPAFYRIWPERFRTILVRIRPGNEEEVKRHLENHWVQFFPELPFEPGFVEHNVARQYQSEANAMRVITFFAVLCIIISALGLYGLTAFMAEQKKKEIGIRKVMGASVLSIVAGMQKLFLKLVLIALVVGLPLAYLYMERWLSNFAYRISIGAMHFLLAAAAVVLVAFLTVLSHSWKAARANPVESIKYE